MTSSIIRGQSSVLVGLSSCWVFINISTINISSNCQREDTFYFHHLRLRLSKGEGCVPSLRHRHSHLRRNPISANRRLALFHRWQISLCQYSKPIFCQFNIMFLLDRPTLTTYFHWSEKDTRFIRYYIQTYTMWFLWEQSISLLRSVFLSRSALYPTENVETKCSISRYINKRGKVRMLRLLMNGKFRMKRENFWWIDQSAPISK